jgi:hypothetical protein
MTIAECKEQLQQDIITYMDGYMPVNLGEDLCAIVIKNFDKLETKSDEA